MRKPHCGLLFTEIVLTFHSEAVSLFIICHVLKYSAIIYNRCLLAPWLDEFVFVDRKKKSITRATIVLTYQNIRKMEGLKRVNDLCIGEKG